jgi:hypothetical protein
MSAQSRLRWWSGYLWLMASACGSPTAPAIPTHEGLVFGDAQNLGGQPVVGLRVSVRAGCRPPGSICGSPAPREVLGDTVTQALGYYVFHYEVAMPDPVSDSATVIVVVDGRPAGLAVDSVRLVEWRPIGSPGAMPSERADFQLAGP